MKELLEEYVMEAMQLRSELDLLRRIVSYMHEDSLEIPLEELGVIAVVAIQVEDGVVSVG